MKRVAIIILSFVVVVGVFLAGSWYNQRSGAKNSAAGARKILYYVDPMHPAYKSDKPGIAPDCGMDLVPVYEDGSMGGAGGSASSMPPGTVNISAERQQLIGLRSQVVDKKPVVHSLRALGRVAVDDRRVYLINSAAAGWVREISSVTVGSTVHKGQKLATFYSPEFLSAEQAYFFALNALDRFMNQEPPNPDQIKLTKANIQQYSDSLRSLGMGETQIEAIGGTRTLIDQIEMTSPTSGIVIARNLYRGQRFEKATEFYKIADLSQVWILTDVFKNEAKILLPGMVARVTIPDDPNEVFRAKVSDILPQFEPASRTLKVRLETDNPGYALRPDMFVDVELPVTYPPTITVPVDALVDTGVKKIVFMDRGEGIFEPRQVETGWRHGDLVEIVKGLMPGERIVVSGTFMLDSESRMKLAAAETMVQMHSPATGAETVMTPVARAFALAKDPICGMDVNIEKATAAGLTAEYQGKNYYFCTIDCKQKFITDPKRYAPTANAGRPNP